MSEKTKKTLLIVGLLVLCVVLAIGIGKALYKEPEVSIAGGTEVEEATEVVVETETTQAAVEFIEETEVSTELVIETEVQSEVEEGIQELQPEAEKTEEEKPETPPETTPEDEPTQPAENPEPSDNTPSNGDTQDGMIYIDGFGWIENEGGGGSGTVDEDMYENGNKVGIMD